MSGLRLWKSSIRLLFRRVNEVWKLDRVLDEEDRYVVADEVPISFGAVELDRKTAYVTGGIGGTCIAGNRRKAHENRRFLADSIEDASLRILRKRFGEFEVPVRSRSAGVNNPFGDAFVIEMVDLLAEYEVFEQNRSRPIGRGGLEGVFVVRDYVTLLRGHLRMRVSRIKMKFASISRRVIRCVVTAFNICLLHCPALLPTSPGASAFDSPQE